MDSYFTKNIEFTHTFDISSTLKSIFRDHSLKSKHSSNNLKVGEIDFSDFESVGGCKNRKLFD